MYEENKDKYGGIGLYFHNSGYEDTNTAVKTSLWHSGIAYGRKFSKDNAMSWGVALNYYYFDTDIPGVSDSDTAISVNLGFLWYVNDVLSFGLLWENLNEPTYTLFGVNSRLIRVMRPGIAYFLSEKTVLTCDIYDLTGNTSDHGADFSRNVRIGFEHYLTKSFSFRLGAHQPNSKVDSSKFYSTGFGWQRSDFLNIYPIQYYLDYTFIYWQDAPAGVEDYLHQLGITLKF
ncbi:MAG: conjugal transfer protein TraF [Candidatus Omnitrophica bacterium]|nr:conjugal transfer protein TraF [Candidatus Omnitrophota bacterium]